MSMWVLAHTAVFAVYCLSLCVAVVHVGRCMSMWVVAHTVAVAVYCLSLCVAVVHVGRCMSMWWWHTLLLLPCTVSHCV